LLTKFAFEAKTSEAKNKTTIPTNTVLVLVGIVEHLAWISPLWGSPKQGRKGELGRRGRIVIRYAEAQ
jgi:hypothetical protein